MSPLDLSYDEALADDELLRELAAMAPRPDAAFAARLDERVAARFAPAEPAARRRPRWPLPRPRWGSPLALGGGGVALVVTLVVVVLVARGSHEGSVTSATKADGSATTASAVAVAPKGAASPSATSSGQSIARQAELSVRVTAGRFDAAAARVPQIVAGAGGTVATSQVVATGSSDNGYFSLRVPVGRFEQVMAQLSALGRVDRRSESSQNVTGAIVTAEDRLGDLRAERDSLRRRLAVTTDDARALTLRDRLATVRRQIARQRSAAVALHQRARSTPIQFVLAGRRAAAATPSDDAHRGTVAAALHRAGAILSGFAAVAIVVLAVAVPLILLAGLLWRGGVLVRKRRRERGLL